MKILLLADINSPHIKRWAESLKSAHLELAIMGFSLPDTNWFQKADIKYFNPLPLKIAHLNENSFKKLKYLFFISKLKKIINQFAPDIVHAHYATSYGLLGSLCGFHPLVLSVWGSDVYVFPRLGYFHRKLLEYNFKKADHILSTSEDMANESALYTNKTIHITPFGVDTSMFVPASKKGTAVSTINIGIVKSLEHVYGIDILIKAFKKVYLTHPNIRLLITGDGTQKADLKRLIHDLNLSEVVDLKGKKTGGEVISDYQELDIAVFPSRVESFGVAIAEASACGLPVIGSNIGGIPEIIDDNITGILVDVEDITSTSNAIQRLLLSEELRSKMGNAGRIKILKYYDQKICLNKMLNLYDLVVKLPKTN